MPLGRREFLLAAGGVASLGVTRASDAVAQPFAWSGLIDNETGDDRWQRVRDLFPLSPDFIHMSAMLIASHPVPVGEAINRYRAELDANPVGFLRDNNQRLHEEVVAAAAGYLDTAHDAVALTDSTTMGVALIYNGLRLRPGQEILTTEHDYYVTHESARLAARRSGARIRTVRLFEDSATTSADEIVSGLINATTPATRVMALTWVHSSTGLKLPLSQIAEALAGINSARDEEDQVLLCVDGVHGFGCEDFTLAEIGCDFFASGCHKWLFGPRGTGVLAGSARGWRAIDATIPSFLEDEVFNAWILGRSPEGPTNGLRMTPGGFKAFEHVWALRETFDLHQSIGKANVARRTHELTGQLKEGLTTMNNVVLHTPQSSDLSAGVVSFHVEGMEPAAVVQALWDRGIVASVAPYALPDVRLTPSIRNTSDEVETVLAELRDIVG